MVFTDGIPEARGSSGEPFGEARLQEVLAGDAGSPAEAFAGALLDRVAEWTDRSGEAVHDLTLAVLRVQPV